MDAPFPDSVSATEVRSLLAATRGEWPEISYEAKVSHSWISKFVNGHIENPGYRTLLDLRAYLRDRGTARQEQTQEPW